MSRFVAAIGHAALRPGSDAGPGNGDRQVSLAGAGAADQHQVALLSEKAAASQVLHQSVVDRRALELEVRQILG